MGEEYEKTTSMGDCIVGMRDSIYIFLSPLGKKN